MFQRQKAMAISLNPIGTVKTDSSDDEIKERTHAHDIVSRIVIFPEFQEALDGLVGFSHIFVLSFLHRLRPDQVGILKVKPRRLLKKGFTLDELPFVGVFAIDSPARPNPIGLSLVRLLRVDGLEVSVSGLDLFDGTPILDIKPYRGDYRVDDYSMAEWYRKLRSRAGEDV
jgi:tRNA-Thr(GGU) m(6)t(6)A37 methyltransferase TsaA